MKDAQDLVTFIVTQITGDPQCFTVETSTDENGVLLSLAVDHPQAGRVLGRGGSTSQAIRTLLRILGTKNHAKYSLKIEIVDE